MGSPIALPEIYKAAFEDFIIPTYETAPFTTIQNRAKVTRSLKAVAGVERINTNTINLLSNEFGPNGERVFEVSNKDARIRFVGQVSQLSTTSGPIIVIDVSAITSFVEITFYGTGLNMLVLGYASRDARATVDGGTESANIFPVSSAILSGRNYNPNMVVAVASGLTLGWHTVKIRQAGVVVDLQFSGFEILNQRTDLAVYSGQGISNGSSQGLSALSSSAFNAGVSGSRGARVVKYVENGQLKSAVQEVDATSKFLALADHTNEEVVRRINFREFGANRADDFSTLTTVQSTRAFTLDDGTTTLVGGGAVGVSVDAATGSIGFRVAGASGESWTLTFVGTGLDVFTYVSATTTIANTSVVVDGVSQGSVTTTWASGEYKVVKLCSGLPYGTHTVKWLNTGAPSLSVGFLDFIIYQPKKPSIPNGALEVADYNLAANYAGILSFADLGAVSSGVLRKHCVRELTYIGTWSATLNLGFVSGWNINTVTSTNYVEYSFFGTGVDIITRFANASAYNSTVRIDGSNNLSGFTTALVTSATGVSFTTATGLISGTAVGSFQANLKISGLPLGLHTVRWTTNSAASNYIDAFDIITPIHINNSNLKVGSQSLSSVTKFSPEKSVSNAGPDLSKAKAWVLYDGVNSKVLSSMNVSAVLQSATGVYIVYFEKPFKNDTYIALGTPNGGTSKIVTYVEKRTGSIKIQNTTDAGGLEQNYISMVFLGELIDQ